MPVQELQFTGYTVFSISWENTLFVINSVGRLPQPWQHSFNIKLNVDFIVNFGVVGGLTQEMTLTKTCIVESVVHYDFDTSDIYDCCVGRYPDYPSVYIPTTKEIVDKAIEIEPTLKKVICASGDKFISSKEKKEGLHDMFNADICEMEAAGVVLTCNRNKVPCMLIKTVSDSVEGGAEEFKNTINESARICLELTTTIIKKI